MSGLLPLMLMAAMTSHGVEEVRNEVGHGLVLGFEPTNQRNILLGDKSLLCGGFL